MAAIKIVLIEDHNLTRMGIKVAFSQQPGMELVGEAASGEGGLTLLNTHQPDIAVVDIGLPDIDGIEVVRQFREAQKAQANPASTKILMLTMHDSEDAVMAAFAAGADSYCMKQTDLGDLMTAVQETHEGNSWIDPAIASIVLRQMRQSPQVNNSVPSTVAIGALGPEYTQVLESYPLTERELEILELIVAGCSNAEIADRSYITVGTVKTHVRNILNKLGVDDRTKAAVRALRAGLVS
jgi:DNA-binding NarL/FixJ family response regulator